MGAIKISTKIFYLIIIVTCTSLAYFPSVLAEDYYADVAIDVDSSGFVTIDGITNHPDLIIKNTEIYTLKKQSHWLLNITKKDIFSDFIYVLSLPKDSSINYIKSSGFIRIENNEGNLQVKGIGENESFFIIMQYETEKLAVNETDSLDLILLILVIIIIVLITLLIIIFIKEKQKENQSKSNNYDDFRGLNQRQKEIMNLLIKNNTSMTQTDIQKELNIPKAAVSRNIRRLEIKGLIEKEQIGMSNLIRIKKQ